MTGTDTTDDFTIEAVDARWSQISHHPCGKVQRFVNPTKDRVRWYTEAHRCAGSGFFGGAR